jgi:hypothetical protein
MNKRQTSSSSTSTTNTKRAKVDLLDEEELELEEEEEIEEEEEDEEHEEDEWLRDWKEKEKIKAESTSSANRLDQIVNKHTSSAAAAVREEKSAEQLKCVLVRFLMKGETVLEALRRVQSKNKQVFESITESADALLGLGEYQVYDKTWEEFSRELGEHTTSWEYQLEDQIYGPFSSENMEAWRKQGYFADVMVRSSDDDRWISSKFISKFA